VLRGGFDIVTTLDPELQELAVERTGIREVAAEDEHMAAALTAVEPGTGRVLAYYGGENGAGLDLAADVGHRPGTSFNTVVFAAAMVAGVDVWSPELDGNSPRQFATYVDDEGEPKDLVNIGGADPDEDISLADAVSGKIDTAVYDMSEGLGGDAIARTAAALGVDRMWDPHDLDEHGVAAEIDPAEAIGFHPDIGIGAYPITTLDAASMHATIAAEGTTAEPFFVETVNGPEGELYDAEPEAAEAEFEPRIAGEAALPLYVNSFEYDDYEVAVNASSTWHTGFSEGLSLAVWAGDERKEGDGTSHEGTIAERIWWHVMDGRSEKYRLDQEELEEAMLEEQGKVNEEETPPLTEEELGRQQEEIDAENEAAQESPDPVEDDSESGDGESSETPDGGDGTT
jgi:membrane peptidoglycan carboxypeptidase